MDRRRRTVPPVLMPPSRRDCSATLPRPTDRSDLRNECFISREHRLSRIRTRIAYCLSGRTKILRLRKWHIDRDRANANQPAGRGQSFPAGIMVARYGRNGHKANEPRLGGRSRGRLEEISIFVVI